MVVHVSKIVRHDLFEFLCEQKSNTILQWNNFTTIVNCLLREFILSTGFSWDTTHFTSQYLYQSWNKNIRSIKQINIYFKLVNA